MMGRGGRILGHNKNRCHFHRVQRKQPEGCAMLVSLIKKPKLYFGWSESQDVQSLSRETCKADMHRSSAYYIMLKWGQNVQL